ncbi:hypothetical protein BC937DRAFT_90599 [Endogone sp. FLAS-F59071]|nr:hypothetical protein BC937DRAFT_90599 [Endogone sp. FLAS-F59071]|eukprot:RUS16968.1 hypothetical protein BC937DRAFT_90599 [Endogone sp. FLAS-F59071]
MPATPLVRKSTRIVSHLAAGSRAKSVVPETRIDLVNKAAKRRSTRKPDHPVRIDMISRSIPFDGCTPLASMLFEQPLIHGVIKKRINRFLFLVQIDGHSGTQPCHCPCTGRIGDIIFSDIPCLLSVPSPTTNTARKRTTSFTVEAISLDIHEPPTSWIGINQNRSNRFVEYFLKEGMMDAMILPEGVPEKEERPVVRREQTLGESKIDFKIGEKIFLEVKTPLIHISAIDPTHPKYKKNETPFTSFSRLVKHFGDLTQNLDRIKTLTDGEPMVHMGILLLCFLYDAPPFQRPAATAEKKVISEAANRAREAGVVRFPPILFPC